MPLTGGIWGHSKCSTRFAGPVEQGMWDPRTSASPQADPVFKIYILTVLRCCLLRAFASCCWPWLSKPFTFLGSLCVWTGLWVCVGCVWVWERVSCHAFGWSAEPLLYWERYHLGQRLSTPVSHNFQQFCKAETEYAAHMYPLPWRQREQHEHIGDPRASAKCIIQRAFRLGVCVTRYVYAYATIM